MNQIALASAKPLYTARVHTIGGRERGEARSSDGRLNVTLSAPGGPGVGTNPEQLLAAGWSACFGSALACVAKKREVPLPADLAIDAEVDLYLAGTGDYFLGARMTISVPGTERSVAQQLLDAAHQLCPYSKAMCGNIAVWIDLVSTPCSRQETPMATVTALKPSTPKPLPAPNTVETAMVTTTALNAEDASFTSVPALQAELLATTGVADAALAQWRAPNRGGLPPVRLQRVRQYIEEHLEDGVGLMELAAVCRLSPTQFSRAFKQSEGLSPCRYVLQCRVRRAQQLLADTDMPLAEIAMACGFGDQSHFCRRFKERAGVAPRRYRWLKR